jgi:hypothetical protein
MNGPNGSRLSGSRRASIGWPRKPVGHSMQHIKRDPFVCWCFGLSTDGIWA